MAVVRVIKEIDTETASVTLSFKHEQNCEQNGRIDENDALNCGIHGKIINQQITQDSSHETNSIKTPPELDMRFNNDLSCLSQKTASSGSEKNFNMCKVSFDEKGLNSSESDLSGADSMFETKQSNDFWNECNQPGKDSEEEVTNAELGLSEDHFSQPDGHFCMSTLEELEMAIENCKELILEAPEKSEKRKNLVKKLIQLRMKLQEVKDGPDLLQPNIKMVLGHHFLKKQIQRPKHYCEKCSGIIWGMLQTWHQCINCGFSCHGKCLNLIQRTCAIVKVTQNPTYILGICPEVGLAAQNYRCAECRTHVMFTFPLRSIICGWISITSENSWVEPRLCDYSGLYYCPTCHWNSQSIIPARVLCNWDFEQYKVCRASKQFLRLMKKKAVLRIEDINPALFSFVEDLSLIKKLREEILIMKRYFLACKAALQEKLLLMLSERQHFVENSDMYSMQDLIDVHSGVLIDYLTRIHSRFVEHIKENCEICRGQGFVCELCDDKTVLFPFDIMATTCAKCSWVFHLECFLRKDKKCPRCIRKRERAKKLTN